MMHYQLEVGNKFLLTKDEVTDIPCIPSAINPGSFFFFGTPL